MLSSMDARVSRLLMSTRADKWAISYMPHWLRIQKIPGLSFRNFDVNEGRQVGNLIYASLVENTEDTRAKLQKLADMNKSCNLVLQLRRNGKVKFQTT